MKREVRVVRYLLDVSKYFLDYISCLKHKYKFYYLFGIHILRVSFSTTAGLGLKDIKGLFKL